MFLPLLQKILPYLNAVLMVLVEIISTIATLVGYDESNFDYFSDVDESVIDLADDLDSASDSAAALKSGLRGFDKLNVITTPTSSSSTSGTGISADVMDLFNDAVDEYNSKLTDVQMKATKIRDSIMEWLGFTKEINEETGEVSFKFEHITSGTILGALVVGGSIYNGIKTILRMLKKITGGNKGTDIKNAKQLFGTIKSIKVSQWAGIALVFTGLIDLGNALKDFKDSTLVTNISKISSSVGEIATGAGLIAGLTTPLGILLAVIAQISIMIGNIPKSFEGLKNFVEHPSWDTFFDMLYNNLPNLGIVGVLIQKIIDKITASDQAIGIINDSLGKLKKVIENVFGPPLEDAEKKVKEIYDDYIKPTIDDTVELFEEDILPIYDKYVKPVTDKIIGAIDEILIKSGILKSAFETIITFLWNSFLAPFKVIFNILSSIINTAASEMGNRIKSFTDIFGGITKIIKGIADGDWKTTWSGIKQTVKGAFEGMTANIKTPINAVITVLEAFTNSVIDGMNAVVKALNKIKITIPNWVPTYGGKSFGINLKETKKISIPRLKTGMDFVPKDFYGPVFLDYGERVLTQQENRDYMNNTGNFNTNSNTNQNKTSINPTIVVQVGNKEIARQVISDLQDMAKSNGKPITIG